MKILNEILTALKELGKAVVELTAEVKATHKELKEITTANGIYLQNIASIQKWNKEHTLELEAKEAEKWKQIKVQLKEEMERRRAAKVYKARGEKVCLSDLIRKHKKETGKVVTLKAYEKALNEAGIEVIKNTRHAKFISKADIVKAFDVLKKIA